MFHNVILMIILYTRGSNHPLDIFIMLSEHHLHHSCWPRRLYDNVKKKLSHSLFLPLSRQGSLGCDIAHARNRESKRERERDTRRHKQGGESEEVRQQTTQQVVFPVKSVIIIRSQGEQLLRAGSGHTLHHTFPPSLTSIECFE